MSKMERIVMFLQKIVDKIYRETVASAALIVNYDDTAFTMAWRDWYYRSNRFLRTPCLLDIVAVDTF